MKAELNFRIFSGALVLLFISGATFAEAEVESQERVERPLPAGARAGAVLELQRSGLAAGKVQPLSGEVAGRSYQRYLDSFKEPMPSSRDGGGTSSKTEKPASDGSASNSSNR